MGEIWCCEEVLKAVFPLLSGKELASCMCVCKNWRETARENYLWKRLCEQKWPSICRTKGNPPVGSSRGYYRLYASLSKKHRRSLPAPALSFDDLEFYVDIWLDGESIYSDVIPGGYLRSGIKNPPPDICDIMKDHLRSLTCKMTVPVNPRFKVGFSQNIRVSLLLGRKDSDKIACVIDKHGFDYVDRPAYRALAYDYLRFSPSHPFVSEIRAWLALLLVDGKDDSVEVFGIEVDFCDAANSDDEVLWLLDMLDWNPCLPEGRCSSYLPFQNVVLATAIPLQLVLIVLCQLFSFYWELKFSIDNINRFSTQLYKFHGAKVPLFFLAQVGRAVHGGRN